MLTLPIRSRGVFLATTLAIATLSSASATQKLDAPAVAAGCARDFETAQRIDMESFRDYDAATFRAGHYKDAVTVFASGAVRYGIDAIMQALRPHFEGREALWTWKELYRVVDGCKAGFILYETKYEIPSQGFRQRALTGVTYSRHHGKWLAIADQGTLLP